MFTLSLLHVLQRAQRLNAVSSGRVQWAAEITGVDVDAERAAIIVCDMWDRHWSKGATERVSEMVSKMDACLRQARNLGVHIIHAPSETLTFYAEHPARLRAQAAPATNPKAVREVSNVPLPIDDSDGGSDTQEDRSRVNTRVWTRQHEGLYIDPEKDAISDDGKEIHAYLAQVHVGRVFIMGVHTNMCILNRSFGIRQLLRYGMDVALVRDLTDAMYNPARSPYVSHDEGTRLVVEYIEKFYCPTISSESLAQSSGAPSL